MKIGPTLLNVYTHCARTERVCYSVTGSASSNLNINYNIKKWKATIQGHSHLGPILIQDVYTLMHTQHGCARVRTHTLNINVCETKKTVSRISPVVHAKKSLSNHTQIHLIILHT